MIPKRLRDALGLESGNEMEFRRADAFAITTARAFDATLLTGDPAIIEAGDPWRVEDLR